MAGETTVSHPKGGSPAGGRQEHSGSGQSRPRQSNGGGRQGGPRTGPSQGRPGSGPGQRPQSQTRSGQGQRSQQRPTQAPRAPSNPNAVAYIDENGERRNKVVVNQPKETDQYDKSRKNKQQRTKESTRRQAMLNTHRINPFKYDMKQILDESAMDPNKASAFLASVIAKASRVSTRDAKDFIKTFVDEGDITKDEADRIGKLLDKYSRYR